ncbi:HMA2 domain-containing protein [Floridanema aerugineum]|uniref:HMA2 domain-containing protein n=1 Tax=Floridaenema aerugineum BLCC-F46 TaxID=3153654 RepID=A0ABV4X0Q4_9CYAN
MSDEVVHSIPGRCRFRIEKIAVDEEFTERLLQLVKAWEMTIAVRINPAARSLIVTYNEDDINIEAAENYLKTCIQLASNLTKIDVSKPEVDSVEELPETEDLIPLVNQWRDLSLPVLSLSLALLATPLELPAVLVGGAIAVAAMPWFNRATESLFKHQQPNIDVLDSLWMGLHTVQGNFVAPALKTCLVESRRTFRGTTVQNQEHQAILDAEIGDNTHSLMAHQIRTAAVHDTQLGAAQAHFLREAVFPTILMGGTIFATTGNLSAAIAPFQFDFGSGVPISISTTLLSALVLGVEHGAYIHSGRVLEKLAQIDTIVLDTELGGETVSTLAIATLQNQGITVYLLHNTNLDFSTMAIRAQHLGIPVSQIISTSHIKTLQSLGKRVAVIGESQINTDISVSMAQPNWTIEEVTKSTADVVLLNRDWWGLVNAIEIARKAFERIYQNTAIIVFPNLIVTFGGIFFGLNPVVNVIVNNGSAFVAEFINSQRPLFELKSATRLDSELANNATHSQEKELTPSFVSC